MLKRNHFLFVGCALTVWIIALSAGCGQAPDSEYANQPGQTTPGGGSPGDGGTGVTIPSNTPPSHSYHFKVKGSGNATVVGGGSMTVSADSMLKIAITAGDQMGINGAPGYTWLGYNCQYFTVKVGNVTQIAKVRRENYYDKYSSIIPDPCANLPTTWVGDFSGALGNGQGLKQITITSAKYDNCRYYPTGWQTIVDPTSGGCPISGVYSSGSYYHTMNGYADVYTD